ncbi:MAG: N-glycosylase/DNA lyase [Candidatus Omnitrophica bacterium]|nr:N-glycosylase/DNA lyase [Candidatus Omnitrophota bacterium]
MKEIFSLKKLYKDRKKEILSRVRNFEEINIKDEKKVFTEMCFCLLTPQSKAKKCWDAITTLKKKELLFNGTADEIQKCLTGVRFHKNKSFYIINAKKSFPGIMKLLNDSNDPVLSREELVRNVKGLGYKEASHFLRNVGLGKTLAILDRHILKNLLKYKVIPHIPTTLTKKIYLDIEKKMLAFSKEIKIPIEHLDLLFWSIQTGEVFK